MILWYDIIRIVFIIKQESVSHSLLGRTEGQACQEEGAEEAEEG